MLKPAQSEGISS